MARSDCWAWILWLLHHGHQKLSFKKSHHTWMRDVLQGETLLQYRKYYKVRTILECKEWITESVFVICSWWIESGGLKKIVIKITQRDEIPKRNMTSRPFFGGENPHRAPTPQISYRPAQLATPPFYTVKTSTSATSTYYTTLHLSHHNGR